MLQKLSLPVQLLIILATVFFLGHYLSYQTIQVFYTLSLIFKECLGFLLPFIVFAFVINGVLSFKKNAPVVIGILLTCIIISNSSIAFLSYFTSTSLLKLITSNIGTQTIAHVETIKPLVTFNLPRIIPSEIAMLCALVLGCLLSFVSAPPIEQSAKKLKLFIEYLVNNLFIPVLPLYVFGFLLEVHHQGVFLQLFQTYGKTFTLILFLQACFIFLAYTIAAKLNISQAFTYIQNALPSYLTAFGTMSSTTAIPVTIQCAEKNNVNPSLAQIATPILANVHLLGDSITVPVLALVTIFLFTGTIPTVTTFATFVIYFCLTMLAVSGIPGGGIIVMIPILKSVLGFTDEMISIITTLYLLQDGLGTAGNVMGDGALMITVNNILQAIGIKK